MTRSSDKALQARFSIPASLAPVYLAFKLDLAHGQSAGNGAEPKDRLIGPAGSSHFAVPIGMGRGLATQLGALYTTWLCAPGYDMRCPAAPQGSSYCHCRLAFGKRLKT